jgi:hypothetical protein
MEADRRWIRTRSDYEVELKLTLCAVESHVDTGINVLIGNAGVAGHIRPPLAGVATQKVIALARQLADGRDLRRRIRAD